MSELTNPLPVPGVPRGAVAVPTAEKLGALEAQLAAFMPPPPDPGPQVAVQSATPPGHKASTVTERNTLCWRQVNEYVAAQINDLHRALETQRDPVLAAELRGEVRALRRLVADDAPVGIPSRNLYHYTQS